MSFQIRSILLLIFGLLISIFSVNAESEKLNCDIIYTTGLCLDIEIAVETQDKSWLDIIKPHRFPNFVAHGDRLFIKNFTATNKNKNTTQKSIFRINFIPSGKEKYEKTRYGTTNFGEYIIKIPELRNGEKFRLIILGFSDYKVYLNNKEYANYSFSHWKINIYQSGQWIIQQELEGENGYTSLINRDRSNVIFYAFSIAEIDNKRDNWIALFFTILVPIIITYFSIKIQRELSKEGGRLLAEIKDNIIKVSDQKLKVEKNSHLKKQIGLLNTLLTELEMLSSKSITIKIISEDYKIRGNLEWFKESIIKNETPLHDMWEINPSNYLSILDNEIEEIKLEEIKRFIVFINQKISLLNFYRKGIIDNQINTTEENLIKIIDEVIDATTKAKKFINEIIDKIKLVPS